MTLKEDEDLMGCIAAIVVSLEHLGYQNAHYAQLNNECGQLILAHSPDGETHFSIHVKTWKPVNDKPIQIKPWWNSTEVKNEKEG